MVADDTNVCGFISINVFFYNQIMFYLFTVPFLDVLPCQHVLIMYWSHSNKTQYPVWLLYCVNSVFQCIHRRLWQRSKSMLAYHPQIATLNDKRQYLVLVRSMLIYMHNVATYYGNNTNGHVKVQSVAMEIICWCQYTV